MPPPLTLALKVVLVSYSRTQVVSTMCIYDDGSTVFRAKKTTICNAKFGDLGANDGDRGSNYVVESAIFGIADPDVAYSVTVQLLWGCDDD